MKRKWLSTDGLSSEVRLNRTEVNNGCLVKGRSSQAGSNKKKKEKEGGKIKTAASLSSGKLPESICLSVQHTVSCHNYPSTPLDFSAPTIPCSMVDVCVCTLGVCMSACVRVAWPRPV